MSSADAPPFATDEDLERGRRAAQEIARQEWREAMMADIPLAVRTTMRDSQRLRLVDLIPEAWRRRALMFRVAVWQAGGAYPADWDPGREFEIVDATTLRRWAADEGLSMLAGLRDGRLPEIPPLPEGVAP